METFAEVFRTKRTHRNDGDRDVLIPYVADGWYMTEHGPRGNYDNILVRIGETLFQDGANLEVRDKNGVVVRTATIFQRRVAYPHEPVGAGMGKFLGYR